MSEGNARKKGQAAARLKSWLVVCPIAFLLLGYLLISSIVTGGKPLTREQAQTLARQTYANMYGLTDAQSAAYTLAAVEPLDGDGWTGYAFTYALGRASFTVRVNTTDGSADVDKTADELRAELDAPQTPSERDAALSEWSKARGGLRFDFWPLADKADFAARYDASAPVAERYCAVPGAGEISPDEAIASAKRALRDRFAYTDDDIEGLSVAPWFFRDRPTGDGDVSSYYEIVFWRGAGDGYEYITQFTIDPATGDAR